MKFKRLKGFPHYEIYGDGTIIRREHVLKNRLKRREVVQHTQPNGYITVTLHNRQGIRHRFYLHRLVWMAFNDGMEIPKGCEIDHLGGDRSDNRIENLRLVSSHKENCSNPQTLARFKKANAPSKGKMKRDRLEWGRERTDEQLCNEYKKLCEKGKCGVWKLITEAHCGYRRAKRIVKMMEGDKA